MTTLIQARDGRHYEPGLFPYTPGGMVESDKLPINAFTIPLDEARALVRKTGGRLWEDGKATTYR